MLKGKEDLLMVVQLFLQSSLNPPPEGVDSIEVFELF